jgi:DNA polymerase-3 subunit epsilon
LAQVYVELTGGRQIGLELAGVAVTEVVAEVTLVRRERVYREPRPHGPSEAELAAHASFLEGVKAPLWNAASAN